MGKNVPQGCSATDTILLDSNREHQVLEGDQYYSTVHDIQQQMIVASENPAYSMHMEHSRWPGQQHNVHGHSATCIDLSREQEMVAYGPLAPGDLQLKETASAK